MTYMTLSPPARASLDRGKIVCMDGTYPDGGSATPRGGLETNEAKLADYLEAFASAPRAALTMSLGRLSRGTSGVIPALLTMRRYYDAHLCLGQEGGGHLGRLAGSA